MAELGNILKSKLVFPEKPILIIFDGGSRDVFQLGDQVLKKYDKKATMFVPTTRIYEEEPLFAGWEKIRQYEESGRWDIQIRENTISNTRQPRNGNSRLSGTGNKTKIAEIYQFKFILRIFLIRAETIGSQKNFCKTFPLRSLISTQKLKN